MTKGKQNMGHRILLDKYYIQYKSLLNVRIVAMLHLARGTRSERKLWSEACKGQGGLGRKNGNSRDPCIICYKRNVHRRNLIFRQSAIIWCANQESGKSFRIYHGMRSEGRNPSLEGRVSCMKQGAPWTKMGRLMRGQKWPKNNKFLEKIAQCPPYALPKK